MVLQREPSWASLRDHLLFGDLVAAHALAPLPLAATLGIASPRVPVMTALTLSLNGNAITVSTALHQCLTDAGLTGGDQPLLAGLALRQVILAKPTAKLRFAVVSPVSNHHYQLRHWLQAAGIDPAIQVQTSVVTLPCEARLACPTGALPHHFCYSKEGRCLKIMLPKVSADVSSPRVLSKAAYADVLG